MKIPRTQSRTKWLAAISAAAALTACAVIAYPAVRNNRVSTTQEKEAGRAADQSTSLNDQTDLNVTV